MPSARKKSRVARGTLHRSKNRTHPLPAPLTRAILALAREHRSGSIPLALRACNLLESCQSPAVGSACDFYAEVAQAVARAQPTMAAVWNVCDRWLRHVERGGTPLQSARRIAQELFRAQRTTAGRASTLIRSGYVVVTYSASSTIEAALRMAHLKGRRFRVRCSEGRPMYEGRFMAQRLAAQAIPVDLFTDSGLLASLSGANLVLVGCDAIFPDGFVNKVGSHALLRMARISRVPAYIVADSFKFLPSAARPSFRIREEKSSEVCKRAGKNLRIRNFYFEKTPLQACSGLITEGGLWPAADVPELLWAMESGDSLRYAQKRSCSGHRSR